MAYAYYPVIPCGEQSSIAFISNDAPSYPGVFIRFTSGVPPEFLGICYHVDPGASDTLIDIPTIVWPPNPFSAQYEVFTTCEACGSAPVSDAPVYQLDPCCGGTPLLYTVLSNDITTGDVYLYTGPAIGPLIPGCYTITRLGYSAAFPVLNTADFSLQQSCADVICQTYCAPCQCYTFTAGKAGGEVQLIDCFGNVSYVSLGSMETSSKYCLSGFVLPDGITSTAYGLCEEANGEYNCPGCYTLIDCQGILDPIVTSNPSVAAYVGTGQSIQIAGYDNCWTVISEEKPDCPCAVNVNVLFAYTNCTECLTPKGYKLTECTTGDVMYTTTDLSSYVGKGATINIDCGGCWTIEELDIIPPSNQPVTVVSSFTDCVACNTVYYTLVKCGDNSNRIYTSTDLSTLVGQVITLKFCPGECWQVLEGGSAGDVVLPENSYATCSECMLANNTCQCQTVTNNQGQGLRFNYYDCSGALHFTPTLDLGETTAKTCMLAFTNADPADVTNYGTCTDNACPADPSPLLYRLVTPGYNTPVCSTEYYETVECAFSEWMYKDVLEKRYGISNCCPDELMKWEIKHEMLMLDILVNPNYVCQVANNCGCNTTYAPAPTCNS